LNISRSKLISNACPQTTESNFSNSNLSRFKNDSASVRAPDARVTGPALGTARRLHQRETTRRTVCCATSARARVFAGAIRARDIHAPHNGTDLVGKSVRKRSAIAAASWRRVRSVGDQDLDAISLPFSSVHPALRGVFFHATDMNEASAAHDKRAW